MNKIIFKIHLCISEQQNIFCGTTYSIKDPMIWNIYIHYFFAIMCTDELIKTLQNYCKKLNRNNVLGKSDDLMLPPMKGKGDALEVKTGDKMMKN